MTCEGRVTNTATYMDGNWNTLYYPQSGTSLGAQRTYFKLNGLTAGTPNPGIDSFTLNSTSTTEVLFKKFVKSCCSR